MKASVWVEVMVTTRVLVEVNANDAQDAQHDAELEAKKLVARALDHDDCHTIANAEEPEWHEAPDYRPDTWAEKRGER